MKKTITLILITALMMTSMNLAFAETDEPSSWSVEAIDEMKGYNEFREEAFAGYKDGITRLEFIYLAVRTYELIDGKEIVVDPTISFNDTDDIYALKGATVGLTSGVGNGNFGTGGLDREQLATFMVRILTLLELEMNEASGDKFADDGDISSWAKDAIYLAKSNNIISGIGNNKVDPKGIASNEMAIVIANRILKQNKDMDTSTNLMGLDEEYWYNLEEDDAVMAIIDEAKEVTKMYISRGTIITGTDSYINVGTMQVFTAGDTISFKVYGWESAGVQTTMKNLLDLWTPDGAYLWTQTADDFTVGWDTWFVSSNGTEARFEKDAYSFSLIIKK